MTTLHVIHGDSAAGTLSEVLEGAVDVPRYVSDWPWADVPAGAPLTRWRDAWERGAARSSFPGDDAGTWLLHDADRFLRSLARPVDRLELWVGPSLDERLFLVWMAKLLEEAPPREVLIHEITHDPQGRSVRSLGEVAAEELAALGRSPRTLTAGERRALVRAWEALLGPTPERFVALLAEDHPVLRPLAALAWRFPDLHTGVSERELVLLRIIRETPSGQGALIVGRAMGEDTSPLALDPWDHWTHIRRLLALSAERRRHPLVAVENVTFTMLDMRVTLTDLGREVLEGARCYLDLGDYDDAVCGFAVDGSQPSVWCCDGGRLVLRARKA